MCVCGGGGGGGGVKEPKTMYTYIQYICKNDHSRKLQMYMYKDIQWKDLPEMTCIVRI